MPMMSRPPVQSAPSWARISKAISSGVSRSWGKLSNCWFSTGSGPWLPSLTASGAGDRHHLRPRSRDPRGSTDPAGAPTSSHGATHVGHRQGIRLTVVVRVVEDDRDVLEVEPRHGCRRLPLEAQRVPRVGRRRVRVQVDRPHEVDDEEEERGAEEVGADGRDVVQRLQVGGVLEDTARLAQEADQEHREERAG